ncbi:hypothetical protein ACFYT3_09795 [Nocardia amikacinitolerans]|uniref:hypothetical protein n=1 Tax=Nocardia amikacinitolerans TaxID=756689 RepID=UPI0036CAA7B0
MTAEKTELARANRRSAGDTSRVGGVAVDWGTRLRLYRDSHLNISRRQFAELLNEAGCKRGVNVACDERHVARWENGEVRRPTGVYLQLLSDLGAPSPDTQDAPSPTQGMLDALPDARQMSFEPSASAATVDGVGGLTLLEALATAVVGSPEVLVPWLPQLEGPVSAPCPGNVGGADLEFVRSMTAGLRQLDQRHGGFAVVDPAVGLLRSAAGLLAGCHDEAIERAMNVAVADLARLVGWASHDIGDQDRARRYATLALVFARKADAPSLVASSLYVLGRISLFEREPNVALRMFQLGQMPAQDATNCGESARLYANEAWAHAMMGDEPKMNVALSRTEDEIDRVGGEVDPWTQVFFTPGEFTGMRSVVYNEFALAVHSSPKAERYTIAAIEGAQTSLRAASSHRPARSLLFDETTMATGAFRLHDTDAAVASATRALQMAAQVRSARAVDRLGRMVDAATASLPRSDVKEVCRQVRQLAQDIPAISDSTRQRLTALDLG